MATDAQIQANRLNAEKSTGPRTAEGKATASQNAVTHGLFAREGVIRGEDREEFEVHRETLLEQLDPVGPLEGILAARIVDLTWRLRRAAQDQNEAFGALYDRHTAGTPEPQEPEERGATLGRMILVDFSQGAVLERLLRYERRIEGSLYRTLNELRRVHDQGQKADQEVADTLGRWREEDWEARKARAFAFRPPPDASPGPAGGTTNAPMAQVTQPPDIPSLHYSSPASDSPPKDETCETNPISEVVSSWKCEVSRESCATESRGGPTSLGHAERSEASGHRTKRLHTSAETSPARPRFPRLRSGQALRFAQDDTSASSVASDAAVVLTKSGRTQRIVQNEPNFGRSLKCEVGGVKRIVQNEPNFARSEGGPSGVG